jgi:hypothetical protein
MKFSLKVFGHKRNKVSGQLKTLNSVELSNLLVTSYYYDSEIKVTLDWTCNSEGEDKKWSPNFSGETACKATTVKSKKGQEENIRKDLKELVCEDGRRMELAQDHAKVRLYVL